MKKNKIPFFNFGGGFLKVWGPYEYHQPIQNEKYPSCRIFNFVRPRSGQFWLNVSIQYKTDLNPRVVSIDPQEAPEAQPELSHKCQYATFYLRCLFLCLLLFSSASRRAQESLHRCFKLPRTFSWLSMSMLSRVKTRQAHAKREA